ncbi:hypothetical protein JH67_02870 [Listeria monocytogenes]|nr:hypothetical protein [Listeria monocytogenes]
MTTEIIEQKFKEIEENMLRSATIANRIQEIFVLQVACLNLNNGDVDYVANASGSANDLLNALKNATRTVVEGLLEEREIEVALNNITEAVADGIREGISEHAKEEAE